MSFILKQTNDIISYCGDKELEDTPESLRWYDLRATYIINLRNERIKELEHIR